MTLPNYQAVGAIVEDVGAVSPAWPTHAIGDIGLLWVRTDDVDNDPTVTLSDAQGFTSVASVVYSVVSHGATRYARGTLLWARASSTSMTAPTIADNHTNVVAIIATARGCAASGSPIDVTSSAAGDNTGGFGAAAFSIPGATTTGADELVFAFMSTALTGGSQITISDWTNADLSSLTEQFDTRLADPGSDLAAATGGKATAGAYTATTGNTFAGTTWTGMTVALKSVIPANLATISFTQAGQTVAGTITHPTVAQVAFTQAANTVAAAAAQLNHVVVNFTQAGDTIAGTITHPTLATVVVTQAGDSIAASAIQVDPAQVTITQAPNTVAAAATQTDKAVVAFTQAGDSIAGTITHPTVAVVAFTQAGDSVVAAGAQLNHAAVAITQAANTVAASAIQVNPARIAFTQAPNTVAAEVQLPSISTNSPAYGIQPITVTWTRLGDKGADTIIAIARQGAAEADMFAWVYTNGTQVAPVSVVANGSYTFPAVTSPGTYVARVITSGAGPAWTVDATSGKAVPANSTEWTALLAAAGIASGGPANIWNCQDASGVLVDANGALNLGVSGDGTQLYFQTVTGWTRKGVQLTDGASARFEATIPGSGTSFIALFYVRLTGVPGATRTVLEHPNIFAEVSGTPRYQADGNSLVVGTVNPGTATHPVLLKSNASNTTEGVYTDDEKLNPTYNSFAGTAMRLGTVGGNGSPGMQAVYGVRFTGAAAELSDAQIKTLLQTLGWTIPWS